MGALGCSPAAGNYAAQNISNVLHGLSKLGYIPTQVRGS